MTGDNSNTRRFKLKKSNTLKTLKIQGLRHKKSLKIKNLEMVGVEPTSIVDKNWYLRV